MRASDGLPGMYLRAIAAARCTRPEVNSSVTACVVRSINSCASSKITASRSGKMGCESTISIASKVWLVTTTSASCAFAFAFAAKHWAPHAHESAPTHSRPDRELAAHTLRSTSGASSRSPETPGVFAHAIRRFASFSRYDDSSKSSPSGSVSSAFIFCRHT